MTLIYHHHVMSRLGNTNIPPQQSSIIYIHSQDFGQLMIIAEDTSQRYQVVGLNSKSFDWEAKFLTTQPACS